MPIDFAVTARICGGVFGNRREVPLLHRQGEDDHPLPRGVLVRQPVLDTAGASTSLNSFETVFSYPTADLPGRPARQGDGVTDASGVRRRILSPRPDEGGMTALILEE
ncbi:hypothetical protein [Niveispirillum sp.]|uniref:head-tail joining protein n=1 Tax=Niveispirillum sp. TaxID=1917217 RepID=UPI001B7392CC|nr:hypothetical protein [Niveispirillum sp.]MBP7339416.1 hypothetical protein [Niveispirillum sp.]